MLKIWILGVVNSASVGLLFGYSMSKYITSKLSKRVLIILATTLLFGLVAFVAAYVINYLLHAM